MRNKISLILIIVCLIAGFAVFDFLPVIGDPASAPNTHVSDYYIENATTEANAPNMVTAVIVDYRAYDTMFETTVMFLAGVGVVLILANRPDPKKRIRKFGRIRRARRRKGKPVFHTINKRVMITIIQPVILVYAIYVLFHGEISLGGGFQAGALVGMTYLLDVMVIPERGTLVPVTKRGAVAIGGVGTFIYTLTGILCMLGGGAFLEYEKLPFAMTALEKHSTGILMVEIGVAIGVASTIITILSAVMERARFDDDTN